MSDATRSVDFLAGFLVGALAGAAAALLFAPQSGEDTRLLIRDRGLELKEQAGTMGAEAKKRAETLQLQARAKVGDVQGQLKRAVEEGKTAAAKRKEELLTKLEHTTPGEEVPIE